MQALSINSFYMCPSGSTKLISEMGFFRCYIVFAIIYSNVRASFGSFGISNVESHNREDSFLNSLRKDFSSPIDRMRKDRPNHTSRLRKEYYLPKSKEHSDEHYFVDKTKKLSNLSKKSFNVIGDDNINLLNSGIGKSGLYDILKGKPHSAVPIKRHDQAVFFSTQSSVMQGILVKEYAAKPHEYTQMPVLNETQPNKLSALLMEPIDNRIGGNQFLNSSQKLQSTPVSIPGYLTSERRNHLFPPIAGAPVVEEELQPLPPALTNEKVPSHVFVPMNSEPELLYSKNISLLLDHDPVPPLGTNDPKVQAESALPVMELQYRAPVVLPVTYPATQSVLKDVSFNKLADILPPEQNFNSDNKHLLNLSTLEYPKIPYSANISRDSPTNLKVQKT